MEGESTSNTATSYMMRMVVVFVHHFTPNTPSKVPDVLKHVCRMKEAIKMIKTQRVFMFKTDL